MTYLGTRPILQDELRQYELHHRARIAIKPGITGMWQVSGRSDITDFEEVVRLDTEYISKPANMKAGIVIGVIADVAIVVFRVQEKLGLFIGTIFGKDTTLTGRTDLWDQALELIGIHFLYGKGDSYALNQYGWLTKTYWNDKTQILEDGIP